jgi:hypothetical protein
LTQKLNIVTLFQMGCSFPFNELSFAILSIFW